MEVKAKVEELRHLMTTWGWSAAIVAGSDPHNSEYTPLHWCQREFISGFTGSSGVVVITSDHAGLWTDSRYYIQASRQLAGTGIELHKTSLPDSLDWADWLGTVLPKDGVVGVDGSCLSASVVDYLASRISPCNGTVLSSPDFLDALWIDRPSLPLDRIWLHTIEYSGRNTSDKLSWLRREARNIGCDYTIISCLDQIAWLLNIRSNDIAYCPLVISYVLVEPSVTVLFVDKRKITPDISESLSADGVVIRPYADVNEYVGALDITGKRIWVDPSSLNYELAQAVSRSFGAEGIVSAPQVIELEKSIKNIVEQQGFRKAYIKDGVAQTRFFHWLEDAMQEGQQLSEWQLSKEMHRFRALDPEFLDESFDTISAYGPNAALPHYETIEGKDSKIKACGLYLIDSGAHYCCGTTDITRTVPMGPLTELERTDYTLVLKAMIDLSMAVFPKGTPGCRLDAVGRRPLWQNRRDFGHGTGHGVGNVLSVHEGPQSIRQNMKNQVMMPGMITSNEPGLYRENMYGIRHENMILCVADKTNEFGDWLHFETLTMTYIDTAPLLLHLLDNEELDWLNRFNAIVYETLNPLLSDYDAAWLKNKTKVVVKK